MLGVKKSSRMVLAPRKVGKFVVGRAAEQDRVALFERLQFLVELDDFGRAHEGKVLRVRVEHEPLSRKVFRAHVFELFAFLDADAGSGLELRDLHSRDEHLLLLHSSVTVRCGF
jgi:hypothetical protein